MLTFLGKEMWCTINKAPSTQSASSLDHCFSPPVKQDQTQNVDPLQAKNTKLERH